MTKINTWEEVDNTLKRLAEIEVQTAKINGDMTVLINNIKEEATKKVEPLQIEKKSP